MIWANHYLDPLVTNPPFLTDNTWPVINTDRIVDLSFLVLIATRRPLLAFLCSQKLIEISTTLLATPDVRVDCFKADLYTQFQLPAG